MFVINLFNKIHNTQSNEEIAKRETKDSKLSRNKKHTQTSGKNYSSCISATTLRRGRFILPDFLSASARIN